MARIAGINIPQNKVVSVALTYIHGIGLYSSKKICKKLDIPSTKRVNDLTEEQVKSWVTSSYESRKTEVWTMETNTYHPTGSWSAYLSSMSSSLYNQISGSKLPW